jgi:hypothetical protein
LNPPYRVVPSLKENDKRERAHRLDVAKARPKTLFYGYTKSLVIWLRHRSRVPGNIKLTASEGGKYDNLIELESLKSANVVFSVEEARELGLEIDHDDSHAYGSDQSFALLLHGNQRKETPAAKALSALKKAGYRGYSQKSRRRQRQVSSGVAT